MSSDGRLAMKAVGLVLGVLLGILIFGPAILRSEAQDKYRLYCRAAFTDEAIDVNGCNHETREWHAP